MTRHEGRPLIVVVEDDETIRELMTDELELLGFAAKSAGTAVEAVELIQSVYARGLRPSLMLLDWELPDGTGDDVLALLERRGMDGFPVVLMTGHLLRAGGRRPVLQVLQKPFDLASLVEAVQQNVGRALPEQPAREAEESEKSKGPDAGQTRANRTWAPRLAVALATAELFVG